MAAKKETTKKRKTHRLPREVHRELRRRYDLIGAPKLAEQLGLSASAVYRLLQEGPSATLRRSTVEHICAVVQGAPAVATGAGTYGKPNGTTGEGNRYLGIDRRQLLADTDDMEVLATEMVGGMYGPDEIPKQHQRATEWFAAVRRLLQE